MVARKELTGRRDLSYNLWHRAESIRRFIEDAEAHGLCCMDVDATLWCEWQSGSKEPLILVETAEDAGQDKPVTPLKRLAESAGRAAYLVLYTLSDQPAFAYPELEDARDLASFRVRRIWPEEEQEWLELCPADYARYLVRERERMLRSMYGRLKKPRDREE